MVVFFKLALFQKLEVLLDSFRSLGQIEAELSDLVLSVKDEQTGFILLDFQLLKTSKVRLRFRRCAIREFFQLVVHNLV